MPPSHPLHEAAMADRQEVEALKCMLEGTAGYLRRKAGAMELADVADTICALADKIDGLNAVFIAAAMHLCETTAENKR